MKMNNKILIKLFVPMIEKEYDLFIPIDKYVNYHVLEIQNGIYDLSDFMFQKKQNPVLILKETGQILDLNKNVKESGLANGDELILL